MLFRVRWEIDIEAENELEAAKKARAVQLNRDSIATVFDIEPHPLEQSTTKPASIDLMEEDNAAV